MAVARHVSDRRFIVTGGIRRYPPPEAEVMKQQLVAGGVAESDIYIEDTAKNTIQSAIQVARIIEEQSLADQPVYVITDTYHELRCRLLLYILGVRTRRAPLVSGLEAEGPLRWGWFYFREILALVKDLPIALYQSGKRSSKS